MDMYQKRKMRQENKNNKEENITKTNINWYPGHMAKTRKQIMEDVKFIDVVIELLDARIPISSQNPEIAKIIGNKKRIVVLNKCDLANDEQNKKWVRYFEQKGIPAVLADSNSGYGIKKVLIEIEKIMEAEQVINAKKGRVGRRIRAIVLGIPNVGKSSFINRISKRATAQVGNKPGVTRTKQWIRLNEKIELLDTPGVLWPKFESEEVALNLSYTGTIKEDVLERTEIAFYLLKFLIKDHLKELCTRYKIEEERIAEIMKQEQSEAMNVMDVMNLIAKKRGAILSGGRINEEKIAKILLDEFKNGEVGKITIETI